LLLIDLDGDGGGLFRKTTPSGFLLLPVYARGFGRSFDAGLERVSVLQFSVFALRNGALAFVPDSPDLGRQRRLPSELPKSSEVFRNINAFRDSGFRNQSSPGQ